MDPHSPGHGGGEVLAHAGGGGGGEAEAGQPGCALLLPPVEDAVDAVRVDCVLAGRGGGAAGGGWGGRPAPTLRGGAGRHGGPGGGLGLAQHRRGLHVRHRVQRGQRAWVAQHAITIFIIINMLVIGF